ncbi:hypothetical protein TNCV_4156661 [Trichonephila clavipes]|nr:hypothetical protein TNCV_4156661 [Trichonephila clavipes]
MEEELPKRKLKKLSRMADAKLQQKVNLKASSNIVLVPLHWSFRPEYFQDRSGIGKLAWKLTDFIERWYYEDTTIIARKRESKDKETSLT